MVERVKNMDSSKLAVIAAVLAVILFVSVNVISDKVFRSDQLDLTANKMYTLSNGTREVLGSIDEPIVFRFYASQALAEGAPQYGEFINRVREMLERYVSLSHGKIRLEVYNPEPYSVEEDQAVAYGLQGVQLDQGGTQVYFGLAATNSTDDQQVIPFFDTQRARYLEYDLTRLVFDLAHPKKKVIGLLAQLPIDADPMRQYKSWAVVDQLRQFFEIKAIGPSVKYIPPKDYDILMVVQPMALSDDALYALDQYILQGGRAIIFVDPFSEAMAEMNQAMRQPPIVPSSDLDKLFKAWGVEYSPKDFIGDRQLATRVQVAGAGGRNVLSDYVAWLNLGPSNFNSDDVITRDLDRIFVADAGSLSKKEGADIQFIPLIQTSERAMEMPAAQLMQPNPAALLKGFKASMHPFTLAARIRGKLKSAFPDGPPKPAKGKDSKEEHNPAADHPHIAESAKPVNMVIVADTDLLNDRSWIRFQNFFGRQVAVPTANNAAFVINAVDTLLGSDALINLRSRGLTMRPFTRVQDLRAAAEQRYRKTEEDLQKKMKETQDKIGKLNVPEGSDTEAILTDSQRQALNKFRTDLISIRQQLREVQNNLRKDIDSLDTWLKILNIWAVPAVVCVIAVVMAWVRRRRRRPSAAKG